MCNPHECGKSTQFTGAVLRSVNPSKAVHQQKTQSPLHRPISAVWLVVPDNENSDKGKESAKKAYFWVTGQLCPSDEVECCREAKAIAPADFWNKLVYPSYGKPTNRRNQREKTKMK